MPAALCEKPQTYLTLAASEAAMAEVAERDFRSSYRGQLAELERVRIFANRRLVLLKALSTAILGADDDAAAIAAGEGVLREEFGLLADNEAHRPILAAFRPVIDVIDTILNCEDEVDQHDVPGALGEFERWYEARTGQPFLALYDVYSPETPVVDF